MNDAYEDTNVPIRELTAGVGQFQMTETERRLLVLLWTLDGATAPTIAKVYAHVEKNISVGRSIPVYELKGIKSWLNIF